MGGGERCMAVQNVQFFFWSMSTRCCLLVGVNTLKILVVDLTHKGSFWIHTFIIFANAFLNYILFIIWVCCALECNISSRWIRYHLHINVLFQCIKSSIGVCEVGGLVTLRARQLLDKKWKGQSAIFLLAHNATSSIYRPALASIVLGKQTDVLWQAASWTCSM